MSIKDQIDPAWQTAIYLCCLITDMSRVYFSSVNVRKSCKHMYFAVRGSVGGNTLQVT